MRNLGPRHRVDSNEMKEKHVRVAATGSETCLKLSSMKTFCFGRKTADVVEWFFLVGYLYLWEVMMIELDWAEEIGCCVVMKSGMN